MQDPLKDLQREIARLWPYARLYDKRLAHKLDALEERIQRFLTRSHPRGYMQSDLERFQRDAEPLLKAAEQHL